MRAIMAWLCCCCCWRSRVSMFWLCCCCCCITWIICCVCIFCSWALAAWSAILTLSPSGFSPSRTAPLNTLLCHLHSSSVTASSPTDPLPHPSVFSLSVLYAPWQLFLLPAAFGLSASTFFLSLSLSLFSLVNFCFSDISSNSWYSSVMSFDVPLLHPSALFFFRYSGH